MMTFPSEKPNPYRDGVCWYGIKNRVKKSSSPCGLDARLYVVERSEDHLSDHGATDSVKMEVWLCDNHAGSLKNDGFNLSLKV